VKIKGRWTYLYRAVDREGKTVDFLLRAKGDVAAAKAFFRRTFKTQGRLPRAITLDGYQASHRAAREFLGEHRRGKRTNLRSSKYLTDVFDKSLSVAGLVISFSVCFRSATSRWTAEKASRAARSRLAARPPRGKRGLAFTQRARRYRSRPAGWTAIETMVSYCGSGDRVAKSRIEVVTLSRSL
jgi:transposase-like protein